MSITLLGGPTRCSQIGITLASGEFGRVTNQWVQHAASLSLNLASCRFEKQASR